MKSVMILGLMTSLDFSFDYLTKVMIHHCLIIGDTKRLRHTSSTVQHSDVRLIKIS